jgi:hypothetical protein
MLLLPLLMSQAAPWVQAIIQGTAAVLQVPEDVVTPVLSPLWDPTWPPLSQEASHKRRRISSIMEAGWPTPQQQQQQQNDNNTDNEDNNNDRQSVTANNSDNNNVLFDSTLPPGGQPQQGSKDSTTETTSHLHVLPDPMTYGEITERGTRQLLYYMGLLGSDQDYNNEQQQQQDEDEDDQHGIVFVDLGSGEGKLVAQAYMEININLSNKLQGVLGVELDSDRHEASLKAWDRISTNAWDFRRPQTKTNHAGIGIQPQLPSSSQQPVTPPPKLELIQSDLFDVDLDDVKATHIYISSLCFTNEMMERLACKLFRSSRSRRLSCVATLKPFPPLSISRMMEYDPGQTNTNINIHLSEEYLEMSWTKGQPWAGGCRVYLYTFSHQTAT